MSLKKLAFGVLSLGSLSGVALADYIPVDISPYVNWNITDAPTGGWPFNTFPGSGALSTGNAGSVVPFFLLDSQVDNVWLGMNTTPLVISTNIESPTEAYTLFNTHWGQAIPEVSVMFSGTNHTVATFTLTGSVNIRDWYSGFFTNNLPGNAQNWWVGPTPSLGNPPNPSRLDMQVFDLGNTFSGERLTSITVTALSGVGSGGFAPFLSGITVAAPVPEPESYSLMLLSLAALGVGWRQNCRRK